MKLSTIIPIKILDEKELVYLKNALSSVENQLSLPDELMVVGDKETKDKVDSVIPEKLKDIYKYLVNDGDLMFQNQINYATQNTDCNYFMYLELDDEINKNWVKNIRLYQEEQSDMDIFLPISVDVNQDGELIDITNQAVWAMDFSDDLGVLDEDSLLRYHNFSIHGSAINVEKYKEFGGLKENVKLTFVYEFLLRMVYNGSKVTTIPRTAYKHVIGRDGSLTNEYKKTLTEKDVMFWLETAKKEYYFIKDRKINIGNGQT